MTSQPLSPRSPARPQGSRAGRRSSESRVREVRVPGLPTGQSSCQGATTIKITVTENAIIR